ncbi:MAG: hypothetical protein IKU44_02760 [Firmicutes bacterium]|nr:hypothetical protein [Bacillota bacterium]
MLKTRNELRLLAEEVLTGLGAKAATPNEYASHELMDKANIDTDSWERDCVVQNLPDSEEKVLLRTILMPSLLEVLGEAAAAKEEAVRIYEIAKTYTKNYVIPGGAPFECLNLTLGAYGPEEGLEPLVNMIFALMEKLGVGPIEFISEPEYGTYHPETCMRMVTRDSQGQEVELGIVGRFHPTVAENFGFCENAYGAELFFDLILEIAERARQYHESIMQVSPTFDTEMLKAEAAQLDELERQIKAMFGAMNCDIES